ncbi:hypothetical protein Pcinc_024704 [Petrolisthes cinctipes]|uniref:PiggyBac transposable element-derived protein 4 C-terminal zinc-ribbon domain-containing protein n=1 Tax=Petrolisthes cinctipes TaxID=88211 RepID=A0AAE1KEW3_PETCI|nr:hypothetical protein Pcinc_024704 [Petrolisthes cinctipes]
MNLDHLHLNVPCRPCVANSIPRQISGFRRALDEDDEYVSSDEDVVSGDDFIISRELEETSDETDSDESDPDDPVEEEEVPRRAPWRGRQRRGRGVPLRTLRRAHRPVPARHHLEYIPHTAQAQSGQRSHGQLNCVHRPPVQKRTSFQCKECKEPLCIPCYPTYHTFTNF